MLRLSSLFLRSLREDPAEAEVASHKLLVRAGYIRRAAPGVYSWLPLGLRVLGKIEAIVHEEMARAGAQQVHFPALLPKEPYEATNRWEEYGPNLFRLSDRKGADYLLAPTHEEMFTLLVKDLYGSYKDLPVTLYQVQTKYRDEARPRAGLIRGREFIMKDAYSFDLNAEGLEASYQAQREAYQRIFDRLQLPYVIVSATSGAMGGSRSEEFLSPSAIGEDTFVRSAGGYAANVEAVTTNPPAAIDFSNASPAEKVATPHCESIEELVSFLNANHAKTAGSWEASETLKNVVLALVHPNGARTLAAVGVPGDRDVDLKRAEAFFAPAEVQPATEEDFKAHPRLVKGYIGPLALNELAELAISEDAELPALKYYLDPRVVSGTSWVSGADEDQQHLLGLVAGRDFSIAETAEVAEVREGDLAPDGSGPLELARGIEIGHIFQLGTKYAEALGLAVLNEQGKKQTVTMGSYGIGVSRVLAALAENNHDERGLAWPINVAPAHVHIVATGKDEAVFQTAEEIGAELTAAGIEVIYDDRLKVSPGVKFADAELYGVPFLLVVGRGVANGVVEFRPRAGEAIELPIAEATSYAQAEVAKLIG